MPSNVKLPYSHTNGHRHAKDGAEHAVSARSPAAGEVLGEVAALPAGEATPALILNDKIAKLAGRVAQPPKLQVTTGRDWLCGVERLLSP